MTTNTAGATIKWTTGSTPPSRTSGNTYSAPIKISPVVGGVTLRAMAYKDGMTDSTMAAGVYELWPASECTGGGKGNESEQPPDENGMAMPPVYGWNGNMTTNLDGSTYTYDAQSRLSSASNAGVTVHYYYDGLNRQVARTVNGAAIYSVYDGWNLVAEYTATGLSKAWLYGPGGIVKELTQNYYYFQDASGSTSHLTDSNGNLLESYRYDLQGTPTYYDANGNVITASGYGITHLYTGQRWESALGLYDLRNRYYAPSLGRFLQPDPIGFAGDAANLYRYCGNNPVNASDPSGEAAVFHYSPSGGYYSYWVNPGWQNLMGSFVPCSGGQCAAGAQILSGWYVGGAYHDVPKTSTWIQGATLGSSTTSGTVVATGWQNAGYPSLNPDAYAATYGSSATVNHTGVLIGFDSQGNAWILNQSANSPLHISVLSPEQQKQWSEVNVAKSNGPYDPARSGTNGGRGAGGTGTFPGGLVIFGRGPNGAALFNDGTGWAPIAEAPADVRWAPNSGTGNYVADRTTQFFEMYSGPQPGEGFHPVSFNKE
jgi:RHS repeat-associated protein